MAKRRNRNGFEPRQTGTGETCAKAIRPAMTGAIAAMVRLPSVGRLKASDYLR